MANLNRDYLVTLDVKTSNVTLSSPMTFYVTDRRTMNIFVKLVMNMSDNPIIKDYVALENAVGYRTELVLVAPNKQPFYVFGELLNEEEALFSFDLDVEQINKVGDWICEIRVYSKVGEQEEIVTSRSFLYKVNESITTSLDDTAWDDTTYNIVENMLDRLEALEEGKIEICGVNLVKNPLKAKHNIGYVPDNHAVFERLTGREYVNHIASCQGKPRFYKEQLINLYKQQLAEQLKMHGNIDSIKIERVYKSSNNQYANVYIRHFYDKSSSEEVLLQMVYTEKGWKIK